MSFGKKLKGKFKFHWPVINFDLRQPADRMKFGVGCLSVVIVGAALVIGGYEGYHFTESSEFCGTICHTMDPQFARYELSEHANVECAKCHIGPGASFFVKSKIDGIRQVVAMFTRAYSRPIKTPVHDLRPARETCETCHSPTSFTDNMIKTITHYDNDIDNTPIQATLILKMGGWEQSTGISQGIHWHVTNPVYYLAADEQRQVVMWVGVEQNDGTTKDYFARDLLNMNSMAFLEEAYADDEVRQLDCIDCHNRTAHRIPSPEEAVDEAISNGLISRDLPYIRAKTVEVLGPVYASDFAAYEAIDALEEFYRVEYATVYDKQNNLIAEAIEEIKEIYSETNFVEMQLNWESTPDNEKHTPFPGCFRCHDDKHVSVDEQGQEEAISAQCNLCHSVPIVGRGNEMLIEAPVIVGAVPESHSEYSWTIEHRSVEEAEETACYQCHGQGFCNNGACHNLEHPENMLFTHGDEYWEQGNQVCYNCHQDISCSRCHPGGIINNP